MKKYKVGLFIGRFQPFHLGHLSALRQGLEICEKVKIVVGSANCNFDLNNPLTIEERMEIVEKVLEEEKLTGKIEDIEILDDIFNNIVWMENITKLAGKFEVVIGNNSLISVLAKYKGFEVFYPKLTKREKLQGKIIRANILENKKWENLVPESSLKFLKKIGFEERLRELTRKDY